MSEKLNELHIAHLPRQIVIFHEKNNSKIKLSKNKLIEKAFQSKEGWRFSFGDIFFTPRDIQVSSNMQIRY